ncbi:unnamed protein product [Nippostrongylus brasiliensis]|uniref:Receptor expression-enhancing protein n=1 Tax=Nippostrongylus brasiliensis TaxID=27835 RepID=A0A0N4YCE8_NIPBR|nr:unnamed protein product [Nippostrongylus brasiliensis]
MFSLLCHLASAVVGAVIPVFYSYKTIKRPSQRSLSYWSKYWAVFGSFLAIDAVLCTLFIHYFVPFYEFGKLLFLIWAVSPQTAGAQFVFDKMLAPFIRRHEKEMDICLEQMVHAVVQRGPKLAITAGTTLLTVAKNLHALSMIRGRLCLPPQQNIEIAEIDDEAEELLPAVAIAPPPAPVLPAAPQPPALREVKREPESDEEVIFVPVPPRNDVSMTDSEAPLPAKRKRGRRAGSGVTRRTKKNQPPMITGDIDDMNDGPGVVETQSKRSSPARRPRAAAAKATKKLLILGDDNLTSEA